MARGWLLIPLLCCMLLHSGPALPVEMVDLIERQLLRSVSVSPDGRTLIYSVERASLENNTRQRTWWLQSTDGQTPQPVSEIGRPIGWHPDSRSVAYLDASGNVGIWNLDSAARHTLIEGARLSQISVDGGTAQPVAFYWSTDGRRLAVVMNVSPEVDQQPMGGVEVGLDWFMSYDQAVPSVISLDSRSTAIIVDPDSGEIVYRLPERYNLIDSGGPLSWSPDSRSIVFAASVGSPQPASYMEADLYVLDIARAAVRPLVIQPGRERFPMWTRDASQIFFTSQAGVEDWTYETLLGVVQATGGSSPRYPLVDRREDPRTLNPVLAGWSRDGEELFYSTKVRGRTGVLSFRRADATLEELVLEPGHTYSAIAGIKNRDSLLVWGGSFNAPADLFLWERGKKGLRRLTDLNPQLRAEPFCNVEEVNWRSADGRWPLHGYLLTPRTIPRDRKLPAIAYVYGGPDMVTASFDVSTYQYPWPLLVQKGYAVFIPNTRGREGFGHEFQHAMSTDRSLNRLPASDVITGLQALIEAGRIDSQRIGVAGWSYGGAVAAYALTLGDMFKAASIGEGVSIFLTSSGYHNAQPWRAALRRDQGGMGSALDAAQFPVLIEESPGYRAGLIKAPSLLEFGIRSMAAEQGRQFYHALRYHNITAEFIVYPRSGHGWDEPKLIADSYRRNLEWFDYWLGVSTTDRMLKRYEQ